MWCVLTSVIHITGFGAHVSGIVCTCPASAFNANLFASQITHLTCAFWTVWTCERFLPLTPRCSSLGVISCSFLSCPLTLSTLSARPLLSVQKKKERGNKKRPKNKRSRRDGSVPAPRTARPTQDAAVSPFPHCHGRRFSEVKLLTWTRTTK